MAAPPPVIDLFTPDDESYSIIERLADAIRIEGDVRIGAEDRDQLVQDLYEGPRKCQCCINWIDEMPADLELEIESTTGNECAHPIIVRRRLLPGESKTQVAIHSIEICNPAVRKVLYDVFEGFDNIVAQVKYLVLHAPFRPFFWRWERFEKAIEDEESEVVKAVLVQIRSIVRTDLAEAFAVSKELTPHGIITYKHLWTLFPPGEVVYQPDRYRGYGRFFNITSSNVCISNQSSYRLWCRFVDWDGNRFGYGETARMVGAFTGTKTITELPVYPERYMADAEEIRTKCIERGQRFCEYAGLHYKAYLQDENEVGGLAGKTEGPKVIERRIMLDAKRQPSHGRRNLVNLDRELWYHTGLITQAPVDAIPAGGHVPLLPKEQHLVGHVMHPNMQPGYNAFNHEYSPAYRAPNVNRRPFRGGPPRVMSDGETPSGSGDDADNEKPQLTDLQLQLCNSKMYGYCLRYKEWRKFDVDHIRDIEWNTNPFDSLVLPEGYKDLILSFVENQLKEGDSFDDVINGKGGGLVILLAGDPGVGKTMTAESVAEKINAPLVKMELSQLTMTMAAQRSYINCAPRDPRYDDGGDSHDDAKAPEDNDDLSRTFKQAARWGAVLLIDECDMYLEQRSDDSPQRNHIVSRFLRELEYYPSLLFLTTNRERVLDPAIYSRIHLTINYPALDEGARLQIWKTFLGREEKSTVTAEEMEKLAKVEVNGRRIKNIAKTARIMAKRAGRGIAFEDIRNVMRITEGLSIPGGERAAGGFARRRC